MPNPIRVVIPDVYYDGATCRHGQRVMASVVEGIESKGFNVELLKTSWRDMDGDGSMEFIQKLDINGDNICDLELYGISVDDQTCSLAPVAGKQISTAKIRKTVKHLTQGKFKTEDGNPVTFD
jgi:hypothetical protein